MAVAENIREVNLRRPDTLPALQAGDRLGVAAAAAGDGELVHGVGIVVIQVGVGHATAGVGVWPPAETLAADGEHRLVGAAIGRG